MGASMRRADLVGCVFGQLTVEALDGVKNGETYWRCRCECGGVKVVRLVCLRRGNTKSCGCAYSRPKTHGGCYTPEYRSWAAMHGRCTNPENPSYHRYGGRGITVCERWNEFNAFLSDMGERPSAKHSIDRIDGNGNYEPSNCRWATVQQQSDNKERTVKITAFGKTMTIAKWSEEVCLSPAIIWGRVMRHGWSAEDALSIGRYKRPAKYYKRHKIVTNRVEPSKRNTSGVVGAFWIPERGYWRSSITVDGRAHYLGAFKTAEEAGSAYADAVKRLCPDALNRKQRQLASRKKVRVSRKAPA